MANVLRRASPHRELVFILALFIGLGILYSTTTPLFEAPDEQWHYAFVQYVAQGRGLPIQTLDKPAHLARQEASQPPLYYLLAAGVTAWIDTSDLPALVWENPHYGYNVPGVVNDNKNLFIHTSIESWPYHGAVLAVHLARLVSVLMGALAVLFTYLLAREVLPARKYLAVGAAALVAFVPQFVFVSSAVSNDSTIVAMTALSIYAMVRFIRVLDQRQFQDVVALGLATGSAALAKVSGAGLVVLGAIVLALAVRRDRARLVRYGLIFGLTVGLVAGWWYVRNWFLYGELTGTAMMVQIFGSRVTLLTVGQFAGQLGEVWETFWVGFGWGNIRAPGWVYGLIGVAVGLSVLGLALPMLTSRGRREPVAELAPWLVLAAWPLVAIAEMVNWMQTTQAPHGRLLLPILPALAPLLILGWARWVPKRVEIAWARVPGIALAVFSVLALFVLLQPAYIFPKPLEAADLQAIPNPVDITFGNKLKLLGYEISPRRAGLGQAVELTLFWQSLVRMDDDYSIGIHALDIDGRVVGGRDTYPGRGMLPTTLWYAGETIRDTYWVPQATGAAGIVRFQINVYSRDNREELVALEPNGQAITPIVGRIKIVAQPISPPIQNGIHATFDRQIELLGYDMAPASTAGARDLALYWQRKVPIEADYTVFVHLVGTNTQIVAQVDRQPGNGNFPTSLWDEGEIVIDRYTLPAGQPAEQIRVGLYRSDSGQRLPVADERGAILGDHVVLFSSGVTQ